MRAKIIILTLICAAALFVGVYRLAGPPMFSSFQFSIESPDKKDRIDVYSTRVPMVMPGQGGAGSRPATVILRNSYGLRVGSNDGCEVLMDDVTIDWNYQNDAVNFAKARSIDLSTGVCSE